MTVQIQQLDEHTVKVNGKELSYPQRVTETMVVRNRAIVRLNSADFAHNDPNKGRNILAYDAGGELLWQIEDAGFTVPGGKHEGAPQGYTGMELEEDGRFVAAQPIGCDCFIDLETGKIVEEQLTR